MDWARKWGHSALAGLIEGEYLERMSLFFFLCFILLSITNWYSPFYRYPILLFSSLFRFVFCTRFWSFLSIFFYFFFLFFLTVACLIEKKIVFYTFLRGYGYQSHFMESNSSDIHAEEIRLINFIANPNLSMTMYNDTLSDFILSYLWVDCISSSCLFGFIRVWVGREDCG